MCFLTSFLYLFYFIFFMDLIEFVVKAKMGTYASDNDDNDVVLDDGSKKLVFEKENLRYVDIYYGYNPFSGQEVVFENGVAVWSMNYYGVFDESDVSAKKGYKFLKKALRTVTKDSPFRGKQRFEEGDFLYTVDVDGDFEMFSGVENIFFKGKEIYKLLFHGGLVKK